MTLLKKVVLSAMFLASAGVALAERYRVVEDSFGNFDALPEQADTEPKGSSPVSPDLVPRPDLVSSSQEDLSANKAPGEVSSEQAVQTVVPPINQFSKAVPDAKELDLSGVDSADDRAVRSASPNDGSENRSSALNPVSLVSDDGALELGVETEPPLDEEEAEAPKRVLGVFERAFLENEGANPYDATVVDESDFVDGDALLEGRVEREGEQPFFITRDVEGNESVTFYSPSLAQKARADSNKKLKFSKSTIYKESDNDGVYVSDLPSDADPVAVHILSAGKGVFENYFDAFGKRCCQFLPKAGVKVLSFERSEHLKVERESLPYRFNEGDSRYVIFKLPDSIDDFAIQLRAFIRRFKDQNIEHGVFYPQLVMLDAEMRPLRIIADPVLDYTPENWSGYGYLQGVFKVDRAEGNEEVYVMINTTKDHLRKVSQYDTEGGIEIRHMRYGELGVKALYADSVGP